MAGGKGGSQTTSVQIPEYIERAAQRNLNKAEAISQIGYTPYYGPDVAAFTPMQQAAMQNTAGAASAFGMAAPSDPMAGMPQAQNFGGVMGYSSAPIYEAAVDQLRAQRPGQYNAMTGLFVDPYTGAASSYRLPAIDYTTMETASAAADRRAGVSASEAAMDRANQLAVARANASAGPSSVTSNYSYDGRDYSTTAPANTYITNPAPSVTNTTPASPIKSVANDIGEAVVGNTIGRVIPSYAVGGVNNPIKTPTVAEMIAAAPSGMSYDPTTGAYIRTSAPTAAAPQPSAPSGGLLSAIANAVAKPATPAAKPATPASVVKPTAPVSSAPKTSIRPVAKTDAASAKGSKKVICTALNELGLLPNDIYALDARFAIMMDRNDPHVGVGYRLWATPIAEYIKKDTMMAKAVRYAILPIVLPWAKEMAHVMRPKEYKSDLIGKLIMAVAHPICRFIGKAASRQTVEA